MTCPVCKRELAPTISVCYTCGAMVNDTVREELETKIERRISKPLEIPAAVAAIRMEIEEVLEMPEPIVAEPMAAEPIVAAAPVMQAAEPAPVVAVKNAPVVREPKGEPTERIARHTSPTLVEFQNKNSNKPDWRIQLQNAVRQRKSDVVAAPVMTETAAPFQAHLATSGANALKAQYVAEQATVEPSIAVATLNDHVNSQKVANALKRIEDSRRRFSANEPAAVAAAPAAAPAKNYPFNVVSRSGDIDQPKPAMKATVNAPPKPRLVSSFKFEKRGLDTNKLPALPQTAAPVALPISNEPLAEAFPLEETLTQHEIVAVVEETVMVEEVFEEIPEELDDLAPLSTRFTSGLFDLIISGFATAILMSPVLIYGGSWLSFAGILTIAAVFGIVTFLYTSAMLGFRGQTLGMKLFGLEVVDVESNEYPTIHQAAVSSAVFLLSIPFFGIGFIPAFLNEERRGAHDLVSGTIVVREV